MQLELLLNLLRSRAISVLALIAVSVGIYGVKAAPKPLKPYLVGMGLMTAIAGRLSSTNSDENMMVLDELRSLSKRARELKVYLDPSAPLLAPSSPVVEPFRWERLRDERDEYPHLLELGKTGGGKSILAENLAGLVGGLVIAVAPHWESGDYPSADLIIGAGRKYGQSAEGHTEDLPVKSKQFDPEPPLDFADIISGQIVPTVCQFLNSLLREMNRRYQLTPDGKRVGGQELTVILDEYNAYSTYPGVVECLKKLTREARKVAIRLILCCQGAEVAALGIEGEGSLRECYTFIRIKQFAIDHAEYLYRQQKDPLMKDYWTEVVRRLKAEKRAVMVEDNFAVMPNLGQYYKPKLLESSPVNRGLTTVELNPSDIRTPPMAFDNPTNVQNSVIVTNTVNNGQSFDERYNARKVLWTVARNSVERGMKRSNIIKEVWGYKSERYTLGCELWRELVKDFGELEVEPND